MFENDDEVEEFHLTAGGEAPCVFAGDIERSGEVSTLRFYLDEEKNAGLDQQAAEDLFIPIFAELREELKQVA